ncbi:hypothetical protein VN97_g13071 [Penicillium thymicola]|uniref:Uncharacterized protein n=1 Tax=Penicillium thymicola TaxID=293382 RepID=A0AAI9X1L5_PENTH|nr:hypothetical protein VN97_g13071 [Penicillium thymicola]
MLPDFDQHLLPLALSLFLIRLFVQFVFLSLYFFHLGGRYDTGDLYITAGIVISGVALSRPAPCRAGCRTRLDPKRHLQGGPSKVFGDLRRHINGLRDIWVQNT